MIEIALLDTRTPPTWDGTPVSLTPMIDDDTRARYIAGNDRVNYFTQQRIQGDLANRDLANYSNFRALVDHLSNRGGIAIGTPAVTLSPGTHLVLGAFGDATVPGWYVAALSCSLVGGGTSATTILRLVNKSGGAVLASRTAQEGTGWGTASGAPTDNRGISIAGEVEVEVRLYNEGVADVAAAAAALVRPRNTV